MWRLCGPNQVWASDITYVPMRHGFLYLTAVMDWYSRYVLSWRLSNTLDGAFCVEALEEALLRTAAGDFQHRSGRAVHGRGVHEPFGVAGVAISMDGRGRAMDNVFVERLWRTVKYEEVYLKDYDDGWEAEASLREYFEFYCHAPASELGLSHAGRGVRSAANKAEHQACDEQSAMNLGVRNVGLRR